MMNDERVCSNAESKINLIWTKKHLAKAAPNAFGVAFKRNKY
jgi:hypothetical protein